MDRSPADSAGSAREIERLIKEARAGDTEALGRLLEGCRRYLLAVANRELPPELQAKCRASDLVQKTFLKAQQKFAGFKGDTEVKLLRWLRRILRNTRLNVEKHYTSRKRDIRREEAQHDPDSPAAPAADFPGRGPSPSSQAVLGEQRQMRRQARRFLREALKQLAYEDRRVILLQRRGHSWEEIGRRMDRSPDAARKYWRRAAIRLGKKLKLPDELKRQLGVGS